MLLPKVARNNVELPIALPRPLPSSASPADTASALAILQQIPGVSIIQEGGVWCYRAGYEAGVLARHDTPRFERFIRDVLAELPKTMDDLVRMRP